jgi:Cdc6-like AAA superfamily ATPase
MATYNINHSGDAIYNIDNKQNHIAADQSPPKEPKPIACASTTLSIEVGKLTDYYIPRNDEAFAKLLQDVPTHYPKVVLVHGEKGTGKTSCCRDFARNVQEE